MIVRIMQWVLAVILTLQTVQAGIVISQVLYDPLGSESGGEAVELRNEGSGAVNISGWVLVSETSAADATIPQGILLSPGSTYLIADAGWSTAKDNVQWKTADHEETITLANADSGIALKDVNGTIVDAVGWGDAAEIKQGLFEGIPAREGASGKALLRTKDTNNNAVDFLEEEPSFFSGQTVVLVVNITNDAQPHFVLPLGAALQEDDSPEQGVQLKPVAGGTRTLHLEVYYNGTRASVSWFNKTIVLAKQGDIWKGELPFEYWFAAGPQNVLISTEIQNMTLPVLILELQSAKLETKLVALQTSPGGTGKGTIKVVNQGNVPVTISWSGNDLVFGSRKIPFSNLKVTGATVRPAETKGIDVILNVPTEAVSGEYRTMLTMIT